MDKLSFICAQLTLLTARDVKVVCEVLLCVVLLQKKVGGTQRKTNIFAYIPLFIRFFFARSRLYLHLISMKLKCDEFIQLML